MAGFWTILFARQTRFQDHKNLVCHAPRAPDVFEEREEDGFYLQIIQIFVAEDMKCDYHPKNIIKDGQVVLCCYTSALIDNDMKHLICNKNNETFLHISANHLGNKQKKSPKYEVNKDEIKRGYIYITINNFNESDFGKYCCIIKFPESFRQNCGEGDVIIQDNSEQDQERCTKSDALITSSTCEVVQECNRNRNNNKASLADPQNNSTKEKRNLSAATILCIVLLLILF